MRLQTGQPLSTRRAQRQTSYPVIVCDYKIALGTCWTCRYTRRAAVSPSNAGAVGMGRRKLERVCANSRIHAADGRGLVVTLRRATGECPGLIGIVLRKVSLFGSRGVS